MDTSVINETSNEVKVINNQNCICADFDTDCFDVSNPSDCHSGGEMITSCCGIFIYLEPVVGICPLIIDEEII